MLHKLSLIFLFCLFSISSFGTTITTSNYKSFIGKKIKFSDNLQEDQIYRIANKKFSSKKYDGKILLISNIEIDKKGNLILFLSETLDNKKEKIIKIKSKKQEMTLENISLYQPKSKHKVINSTKQQYNKTVDTESGHWDQQNKGSVPVKENQDSEFDFSIIFFVVVIFFILGIVILVAYLLFKLISYVIYFFSEFSYENQEMIQEVTSLERGERSERSLILKLRKNGFDANDIFHDLYVPIYGDKFSQIDLILLTTAGIIVFEIKEYSGWLFGNGKHERWTQVLNYGKEKHRFYNPIMQNAQHISQLQKYLKKDIPFFSVIVFYGNCELKDINLVPENTFVTKPHRVMEIIERICRQNTNVNYDEKVKDLLMQAVKYGDNPEIVTNHKRNIHNMLGKDRIYH